MEALEEQVHISSYDGIKETITNVADANNSDTDGSCHKTNGMTESASEVVAQVYLTEAVMEATSSDPIHSSAALDEGLNASSTSSTDNTVASGTCFDENIIQSKSGISNDSDQVQSSLANANCDIISPTPMEGCLIETQILSMNNIGVSGEVVAFETEVFVEKEETVSAVNNIHNVENYENYSENKMLSQLEGQNIDLGEALTPDGTDSTENNNFTVREEVFNKEELLDILEGNDLGTQNSFELTSQKEKEIAIQQLSRLKKIKKNYSSNKKISAKSKKEKKVIPIENKVTDNILEELTINETIVSKEPEDGNIVQKLVQDWEDDDVEDKSQDVLNNTENSINNSDDLVVQQKELVKEEKESDRDSIDSLAPKDQSIIKPAEENHPQRRGRIIKKKVIFDPDNPDTFTKSKEKPIVKTKDAEKDQPTPKKVKLEQPVLRATSKSPVSKSPWKKPTPKNNKQHKRLTEVDKLLMDEGAVNMIYQLTPEAPKGRKNMRTKAEFIKKVQSSTPDGKEMKFRERKKEKIDESEAKRILVGKQRTSVSGSIASMSVNEDFDTNRPDDSIIYRRHSSSSYSSACMSPRRLSDVESGLTQNTNTHQIVNASGSSNSQANISTDHGVQSTDVFMVDKSDTGTTEAVTIKKEMTLKEKLNSKLSTVLHKRKRETKTDKPAKQKKLSSKFVNNAVPVTMEFKTLSISFLDRVSEICIKNAGLINNSCGIEVFEELEQALQYVNGKKDFSVTLLTSESGTLCSVLDLKPLLDPNMEKRTNYALGMTESVRAFLLSMEQHSKLLIAGVSGACEGPGLAALVMCDVAVASERATFALAFDRNAPIVPGVVALNTAHQDLQQALVKDLVLLGRQLSASEAEQRGLVSRTLWPDRFYEQLRALAKDIAAQPLHTLLLKKQLLNLSRNPNTEARFQSSLSSEQDMVAAYWTSMEGQEFLRAYYNADT